MYGSADQSQPHTEPVSGARPQFPAGIWFSLLVKGDKLKALQPRAPLRDHIARIIGGTILLTHRAINRTGQIIRPPVVAAKVCRHR